MALNVTAYEEYSPLYLPITFATTYGIALMLTSSLVVHTAIYHGHDIYRGLRKLKTAEDIHMKLMRAYPEVPEWWYFATLLVSVGLSIVAVAVSPALRASIAFILIWIPVFLPVLGYANARLGTDCLPCRRFRLRLARGHRFRHDEHLCELWYNSRS